TGTHVPLHCTATGKLYLSQMEPRALDVVLDRLELNKLAPRTIVDAGKLKAELKRTRQRGYATDNEEFIEGLVAVSVPVCGPRGRFCAGLAVHAPKFRMNMKTAIQKLPALRKAADRIEHLMQDSARPESQANGSG
ncbi:MAG: IclR family transcriptional regulator, partial [Methyloligellaceae bacterium]